MTDSLSISYDMISARSLNTKVEMACSREAHVHARRPVSKRCYCIVLRMLLLRHDAKVLEPGDEQRAVDRDHDDQSAEEQARLLETTHAWGAW